MDEKIKARQKFVLERGAFFMERLRQAQDPYTVQGELFSLKELFGNVFGEVQAVNAKDHFTS